MSLNQISRDWASLATADCTAAVANIVKALATPDEDVARSHLANARACLNQAHENIISAVVTAKG